MSTNQEKAEYLKTLGFDVHNIIEVPGYDTEIEYTGDYDSIIYTSEFEIGDSIQEIIRVSDFYSCCGEPLDKDIMICPTCKEHC